MPRLLSGRVGVTSFSGLSTDRNQTTSDPLKFLGVGDMEPNLGLPPNNDYILFGNTDGTRRWDVFTPSGAVDGITVLDEGITPTGFAGSITKINFQGNGVEVTQIKEQIGNAQIGLATVFINKSTNDIMDSSGFVSVVGVTTFKIGVGLSFVPLAGQTGIVSIFNTADAKFTFQDDRGLTTLTNIGQIRVGAGLTVSESAVGVASISPTGHFEHIKATGIVTAASFVGPITGNVTGNTNGTHTGAVNGNVTGDLVGNVTGNVTGDLTGDFNAGISTVTELKATTINATGIITTSQGFIAPVGSFGFNGSLISTGISTVAFFSGTNINVSGIATADGGFVAPAGGTGFTGKLTGDVTGNIKSSGVSTTTYLQTTHVNASGIITATGGFVGNVTGSVAGAASLVTLADESADSTCFPVFATGATGDLAPKTDSSALLYNASNGTFTAAVFSGSGASLTNIPGGQITGALAAVDGSALTDVISTKTKLTATNTTAAEHFITFVDTATGNEDVRTDTNLTYNPGTNILSATTFNGNATGLTGTPSVTVGDLTVAGSALPDADNTRNLGGPSARWANIYTADMHFSNKDMRNSVDGTWGDWTLQEGESTLFLLNNRNGKKYSINLTEV
tara:strand:- start:21 stop:1889 length:1869 start_codon:yes stop_codon:yes gene_type:complete